MRKSSGLTSENQELADQQLDQLELKISAAPKSDQIVLISLKTAFGGSPSNLQLCWRLLALSIRNLRVFVCDGRIIPPPQANLQSPRTSHDTYCNSRPRRDERRTGARLR